MIDQQCERLWVSTHSRAEAAAPQLKTKEVKKVVSTHSRAEAAAVEYILTGKRGDVSTHSRAEAAAKIHINMDSEIIMFQHTAARRRLPKFKERCNHLNVVSTHSRAEAAALMVSAIISCKGCFNTQPRGGGCWRCKI